MAHDKHKLALVENAVHAVLSPLGFKKHKTSWRRPLPEVLQQLKSRSARRGTGRSGGSTWPHYRKIRGPCPINST